MPQIYEVWGRPPFCPSSTLGGAKKERHLTNFEQSELLIFNLDPSLLPRQPYIIDYLSGVWVQPPSPKDDTSTTATAAMSQLDTVRMTIKYNLYNSHVPVLLYGCETVRLMGKVQPFESKCPRKLFWISHREHTMNGFVQSTAATLVGHKNPYLQLFWFGHVTQQRTVDLKDCPSKCLRGISITRWPNKESEGVEGLSCTGPDPDIAAASPTVTRTS